MTDSQGMHAQLQTAFEFDEEELSLNRSGTLSARQKKLLEKTRQARGCGRQAAVIGLGGTTGLFGLMFVYLLISGSLKSPGAIIAFAVVLAILASLSLGFFILDFVRGRDLKAGRITVVEGKASQHQEKTVRGNPSLMGDLTEYYVRIGGKRLRLDGPQQLQALRADATYRLYMVKNPPVDIVLSAEEV